VQLGAIPAASAGIVAQERVAMVVIADDGAEPRRGPAIALPLPPSFLTDRHADAQLFIIAPGEARVLEMGALIYADADETDPLNAIGVVVRIIGDKTIALVRGSAGQQASLREPGRAIAIKLIENYRG